MQLQSKYYNKLLDELYSIFFTIPEIITVLNAVGLNPGDYNLANSAKNAWDSILSLTQKNDRLIDLVDHIYPAYKHKDALTEVWKALHDNSAWLRPVVINKITRAYVKDRVNILFVNDKSDQAMVNELKSFLFPMERYAEKILMADVKKGDGSTDDVQVTIAEHLAGADIVLAFLSPNFFASDNGCADFAFNALELKKRVVPILLKPCLWNRVKVLNQLVALPRNLEFVSESTKQGSVYLEIASEIERVVDHIMANRLENNSINN